MKKISLFIMGILSIATLLSACKGQSKTATEAPEGQAETVEQNLVGNDRDEHGCIGSAGYVWSEVAQECVRPWESDLKLTCSDPTVYNKACVFFSADSTQIEIMGMGEAQEVLTKTPGRQRWSNADESVLFFHAENAWVIVVDNVVKYVKKVL